MKRYTRTEKVTHARARSDSFMQYSRKEEHRNPSTWTQRQRASTRNEISTAYPPRFAYAAPCTTVGGGCPARATPHECARGKQGTMPLVSAASFSGL
ncbi:hypothetical protein HPB50_009284 [Hyalomma asiaticum]|uniref:Uncharacterized protein n=1 Tax=Hyalomma asiaticum TaxID=266040 RepID=A0ACB7TFK9_HYAAI|nr:hypothetical protein HPB50_009284 [Hyalomma asiaticum]